MEIWIYLKLLKNHLKEKNNYLSKPERKFTELWPYLQKQIDNENQIFWVCPLIESSKFLDYSSAKENLKL